MISAKKVGTSKSQRGFTIIELIVVIVVIGVIASLVYVSYTTIQQNAKKDLVQSDLDAASATLELDLKNSGHYPASTALADGGSGLPASNGTTYQYTVNVSTTTPSYCLTATNGIISYKMDSAALVAAVGGCPGHGVGGVPAITNLANNTSAEIDGHCWSYWPGTGTATLSNWVGAGRGGMYTSTEHLAWNTAPNSPTTGIFYGCNNEIPATPGTQYAASSYVRTGATRSMVAGINWYNSSFAMVGSSVGTPLSAVAGVWTRISAIATAPAGAAYLIVTIYGDTTNWSVGNTLDGDDLMVTQGSTLYNFADGRAPNWIWNGMASYSTSTGPAP